MKLSINEFERLKEPRRRLRTSEYEIPKEIELANNRLIWKTPVKDWKIIRPTRETFDQFLTLADATNDAIMRFARRWGVLWLCLHGEPTTDVKHWNHELAKGESLADWRRWSRLLGAIVRINENHDEDQIADATDWQILWDDRWFDSTYGWTQDRKWKLFNKFELFIERNHMTDAVNRWLQIGDVRPGLTTREGERFPVLTIQGVFGVLAVSLLEETGGLIAACSGCRKFYRPTMRPKVGQDRYCQVCRNAGIPVARAKLRQTLERKRAAKARKR